MPARICECRVRLALARRRRPYRIAAVYTAADSPRHDAEATRRSARPESGHAQCRKTKEVVHIDDIRTMPPYLEGDPRLVASPNSAALAPCSACRCSKEMTLLGVIAIYRNEVRPFTDKQIELVRISPRRPSSPSRTRGCSTSCAQSLQQQTATADVLKVISRSTFDLQTVLDTLVESAARLCEADMAAIPRQKGAVFDHVASYGY